MQRRRKIPGIEIREQLQQLRAANEALQIANRALQVDARRHERELFESWKSAGEFNKAEKYYRDLLAHDLIEDTGAEIVTMLDLKQSYVDMLIKQGGRFEEAVGLAEEVWGKRNAADPVFGPVSDLSKESHRHLCSIYAALKRLDEVERMHKSAYDWYKGRDDAWALENGDECCKQLAEQLKFEEALVMQANVWKEREKTAIDGPSRLNTIKSGKSRISLLEKFIVSLADQDESVSQKNLRRSEKELCEQKIDQVLQSIWATAGSPETEIEILDVGHELGARLLRGNRFSEAEIVFDQVWQRRKRATNETDLQAMETGIMLATALRLQKSTNKNRRAVFMYRQVWNTYKIVLGQGNDETIAIGKDLAATLDLLGQYSDDGGAEGVYGWILEQIELKSQQHTSATIAARFDLGQAMYRQGQARYDKATELLQTVYDQWYKTPQHPADFRGCGRMLLEMYKHQKAVEPLKALFEGEKRLETEDMLYMESGYAYCNILVEQENYEPAREPLRLLWEDRAAVAEENEYRLWCGLLYGRILLKLREYDPAKVILQAVLDAQIGVFKTGTRQFTYVSTLLREAQQAIPPRAILKPRDKNIRAGAKPKKHANVK